MDCWGGGNKNSENFKTIQCLLTAQNQPRKIDVLDGGSRVSRSGAWSLGSCLHEGACMCWEQRAYRLTGVTSGSCIASVLGNGCEPNFGR